MQNSPSGYRYGHAVIACVAILVGFGLMAIYASSSLKGSQQYHDEFFFLRKQAVAAVVGFGVVWLLQKLPVKAIERVTLPLLALTIFLLALIFIPGMYVNVKGAERWLALPGVGGQPSELTKLAMILFLAKNLSRPSSDIDSFGKGILPNLAVFGVFTFLLLFQKDLGTPVLLFSITGLMLFVAGVARKLIVVTLASAVALAVVAIIAEPYRVARILSFLDPWSSAKGAGFQIIQSFLAFRNGGFFGAGLGESRQKLFFLPEAHTDFILSVIGEELGIMGVLFLCGLFGFLAVTGFRIARAQPDAYRRFLAFGVTATIVVQAAMNMGVTMGLLPTKGIPLPFISSGNSSLLVFLCMTAVLARLGKDVRSQERPGTDTPAP